MAERQIDPARLEGEALRRWYSRSPDQIQRQRQAAEHRREQVFFDRAQSANGHLAAEESAERPRRLSASADDRLWIADGHGGFRPVRSGSDSRPTTMEPEAVDYPEFLPESAAAFEEGDLQEIVNPHHRRLRGEWKRAEGRPWPKTSEGRNFDVAHTKAVADGGTNTLDNIQPMHPDEHKAQHRLNGDHARFGRRSSIARAFGGRVEPPANSSKAVRLPTMRGLGIFGLIPNITGVLSGRIRTDTPIRFWNDMSGLPSRDNPLPKDLVT